MVEISSGALICAERIFSFQHLAATRTYANLDVPLSEILDSIHDHDTRPLVTCHLNDQLFELMDRFVTREVEQRRRRCIS